MRLGVVVMQTRPWRELAGDFRLMEEVGYDAAYVYDHLSHPSAAGGWLGDGFTTLAAVQLQGDNADEDVDQPNEHKSRARQHADCRASARGRGVRYCPVSSLRRVAHGRPFPNM